MNPMSAVRWRTAVVVVVATSVLLLAGCTPGSDDYESPIINEDVPAMDIADLPDIDATRAQ